MDVAGDAGNSPLPFSQEGEHDPTQQESCNPPINVESMSTPQGVETRETLETTAQTDAQTEAETDVVKKDRRKSIVWKHFGLMMVNGLQKAQCNYCKKLLGGSSRNGTKHLLSHMDTCVPKKMKERGSNSKGQSFLMPKIIQGKQELGAGTYDAENARKELAHAIIMHDYPLSIVDHCGFKRYSAALQPLFQVPSRNTIKKEIFKVYEYERSTTMKLLDSLQGRVAITSDMWTSSNQKRGYMAVTAHYIDESWTLQSHVLRFIYVTEVITFAKDVCERLKLFNSVTEVFSGTKYPTANLYFSKIYDVKLAISKWIGDSDTLIKQMAEKMLAKFDKYWNVIHDIMGVASVLDPRFKIDLVEYYYEQMYGHDSCATEIQKIKDLCYALISDY